MTNDLTDSGAGYTVTALFESDAAADKARVDHLLVSPTLAGRLVDAGVDRAVRGEEKPSDHAPTWIELTDE